MGKNRPDNTVSHQLYVPIELDKKLKSIAEYGKVDDLIIDCIREAIAPRYKKWIEQEYARETGTKKPKTGVR